MKRSWTVLLIGGSSGTGKSHIARQLSEYYKVPLLEIDDIRIALQQIVDRNAHPDLYFFLDNPQYLEAFPADKLVEKLFLVGKEIWPALTALIEKHIACLEPVIFEGDGIIPDLVAKTNNEQLKSIFLFDTEEEILDRTTKRNRGEQLNQRLFKKQAEFSFLYGQKIKKQAEVHNLLVMSTSPIDSLFDRATKYLE